MTVWQQWVQRPQNLWVRKALFQVHLWVGIGIGLYILLISVSGSAIVYRPQLIKAFARTEQPVAVKGTKLSEAELTQHAEQGYPGYRVADIFASRRPDRPTTVLLKRGSKKISRLFDPYTASDLGDPSSPIERTVEWLVDFHDNLLSGPTGRFWNGVGSIMVTLTSLTGLILWWPGIRSWRRSTLINWKGSFPLFNWTLHSALGFWCSAFVLMWGLSGIYFIFPDPFNAVFGDSQFLVWLARLHFGRFGRIGRVTWPYWSLSMAWVILGLVPAALVVTGFLMWWNRKLRRRGSPVEVRDLVVDSAEARKETQKEEVMTQSRNLIILCLTAVLGGAVGFGAVSVRAANEDPCNSLVPAAIGGPMLPAKSDTMVLRWLANANYEIAYRGKVYLFDTYYDRKARTTPLGFTASQVKTANIIFLGHGHFDHISDIVPVAKQTNAPVVGAPITIETAVKMGLPPQQATTVKGGETLHYDGLAVDIALAHHSVVEPGLTAELATIYKLDARPSTPEEAATTAAVMARGTNSPDVADKGTLAFGLTFDNGFKVLVLDSAGPITDGDRQLAQKLGPVDVAIIAYQAHAVAERQVGETFPLVQLFHPRLYLPAHHDGSFGTWLDVGVEPLFEKIRDEQPDTSFLSPLYRSPICVATSGAKRGTVIKFRY